MAEQQAGELTTGTLHLLLRAACCVLLGLPGGQLYNFLTRNSLVSLVLQVGVDTRRSGSSTCTPELARERNGPAQWARPMGPPNGPAR